MPHLQELHDGLPLRGLVSVPRDSRFARPMLVFLHGNDEAAPAPLRPALTRHGPLRRGNDPVAGDEFVIVAPQLPWTGDHWRRFAMQLAIVLSDVEVEHHVDPDRVYLTGFSFGANGVFDLALAHAYPWAALWAVEPTRVPARDVDLPVWISAGEVARQYVHPFKSVLPLAFALEHVALPDCVWSDERLDHVATATSAYASERVYRWLLRHRRPVGLPATHETAHPGRG